MATQLNNFFLNTKHFLQTQQTFTKRGTVRKKIQSKIPGGLSY